MKQLLLTDEEIAVAVKTIGELELIPGRGDLTAQEDEHLWKFIDKIKSMPDVTSEPAAPAQSAADYMTDVLQMKIDDLPANELDMPIIEGQSPDAAYIKFMSDGGDHDEILADRFEAVLADMNVHYLRTTPRIVAGDLSKLPGVVENWFHD